MKTVLKKIYTLLPLIVILFFFQNCASKDNPALSENNHLIYQGISNIN